MGKRIIMILLSLMLFTGCSSQQEVVSLRVLCPQGAPSLAFLNCEGISMDYTEGSDALVAELGSKDGAYDVVVAPINVGMKLIASHQSDFDLAGVLTWGNLYLIGSKDGLNDTGSLALFGEGAVPGKIYELANIDTTLTPTYVGSAPLVSAQLLSGQATVGLLPEPLATATIAKAKAQGLHLEMVADLQKAYQETTGSSEEGYPQAAVFVRKGVDASSLLATIEEYTQGPMDDVEERVERVGAETLGLPSARIAAKTLERQHIRYIAKDQCKIEIEAFLKLLQINNEN